MVRTFPQISNFVMFGGCSLFSFQHPHGHQPGQNSITRKPRLVSYSKVVTATPRIPPLRTAVLPLWRVTSSLSSCLHPVSPHTPCISRAVQNQQSNASRKGCGLVDAADNVGAMDVADVADAVDAVDRVDVVSATDMADVVGAVVGAAEWAWRIW